MNTKQLSNKKEILTKHQEMVLKLLEKSVEPLKAYSILFNLSKHGVKAPLQVYRALDKLMEIGKVHKIESKNAFVACINSNCTANSNAAFTICEECDVISELHNNKEILENINYLANQEKFKLNKYNLELYITCKNCLK
tara:strand:+ start:2024 stop:2440 length:417 start_codon:yes stop_codon:yes gene_type:complete